MKTPSFIILALFSLTLPAHGAETGTSVSQPSAGLSLKGAEFSYAMLLKGSSIQYPDGNSNGKGTNLSLRHYQDYGYRLGDTWKLTGGTHFRQYFRPADPKRVDQGALEWRDPFLGVSRKDVWKSGEQAISAKARYFLPITDYNASNVEKEYDEGKGSLQVGATYTSKLADGLLGLRVPVEANYRFNKNEHKVRQDYWFGSRPSLSCRTGSTTSAKIEYYTGDINHKTNGTWTKLNDPVIGQTAALGFDWTPTRELLLAPQITWGRQDFRFNAAEISMYASYIFL